MQFRVGRIQKAPVLFFVSPSGWKCLCERWWLSRAAACFCNIVAAASIWIPLWNNTICLSLTRRTCWSWALQLVTTVALTPFISRSREHIAIRQCWPTCQSRFPSWVRAFWLRGTIYQSKTKSLRQKHVLPLALRSLLYWPANITWQASVHFREQSRCSEPDAQLAVG